MSYSIAIVSFGLSFIAGTGLAVGACRAGWSRVANAASIAGVALGVLLAWWFTGWTPDGFFGLAITGFFAWIFVMGALFFLDDKITVLYEGPGQLDFSDYICEHHGMPGRGAYVTVVVPGFGRVRHASMGANLIESFRDETSPVQVTVVRNALGFTRVQKLVLPGYEAHPLNWEGSW